MLKTAFDDNSTGKTQTFQWFSQLKRGKILVEDCKHSCHPSTDHTDKNADKLQKSGMKIGEAPLQIASRLHLSCRTSQQILRENLKNVAHLQEVPNPPSPDLARNIFFFPSIKSQL